MDEQKPLEEIVSFCETCRKDTKQRLYGTVTTTVISGYGNNLPKMKVNEGKKSDYHYACTLCGSKTNVHEKRRENVAVFEERRKHKRYGP